MNWNIMLFTLLFTVFGALTGCLATLYILRKLINVRMKSFYKLVSDISLYRVRLNSDHKRKINILKRFAHQEDNVPESFQHTEVHVSEEELSRYFSELTQLLQQFKIDPPVTKK